MTFFTYFRLFLFKNWQYHKGVRATWLAKQGGNVYKHPYNLGAYENLATVITSNGTASAPGFFLC